MNQQEYYIVSDDSTTSDVLTVGGKGLKLLDLTHDFRVPPFCIVPAGVSAAVLQDDPNISALLSQIVNVSAEDPEFKAIAAKIRDAITLLELPERLLAVLSSAVKQLGTGPLAVRSSAIDEDAAELSFAGLHDSYLYQQGIDDVILSVKKVWASAYNERALAYRIQHVGQSSISLVPMAVVIQKMIDARTSGVAFTCHPATYDVTKTVVSSLWGAGEGLVSEGLDADTFVVDKQSKKMESDVAEKSERMVVNKEVGSGLCRELNPSSHVSTSSLSDDEIAKVAQLASDIEQRYGCPQDIEFCFDSSGVLYLLQARPVASVPEYGPAAGYPLVWDNSNIIESYSGVTSPMTFSFIRRAYTIVYHCFAEVMGIRPSVVRDNRTTFENMLGLIRGRVYYNIKNWYRLIKLFPGYEYNSQAMESMMGIKESFEIDEVSKPTSFWKKWFVEFPKLIRLLVRSIWNFARIRPLVNQFQSNFTQHYEHWEELDFNRLPPNELMLLYGEMEDALLWNWKAPIINDFYVMIYFGLLRKVCKNWCLDQSDSLQNDLVCGEPGIESAEPAKFLLRLAQKASQDDFLRNAIVNNDPESLPTLVAEHPECKEFQAEMHRYLDLYGFRCMNELKLEEFSLRDRPHVVYQMLRNYLKLDDPNALDVEAMHVREQKIRTEAEQRVSEALSSNPIKKWLFQRILKRARLGVKNRENMRFARTRIYGIVRELLRATGLQFAEENILPNQEDIFYLTIDEVWDYVKGTAVTASLADLAALRRKEFDAYQDESNSPDERFTTYGMVNHRNLFQGIEEEVEIIDGELRGIGVCAGEITGEAKVIRDPSDNVQLSREILIAERTDPGWVPLYPAVSGILIERGSVLSHSAVVAREMGIPTIVGIRGLLKHVSSGDIVKMDGRSGVVEVVDSTQQEATVASDEVATQSDTSRH